MCMCTLMRAFFPTRESRAASVVLVLVQCCLRVSMPLKGKLKTQLRCSRVPVPLDRPATCMGACVPCTYVYIYKYM